MMGENDLEIARFMMYIFYASIGFCVGEDYKNKYPTLHKIECMPKDDLTEKW